MMELLVPEIITMVTEMSMIVHLIMKQFLDQEKMQKNLTISLHKKQKSDWQFL